MRSFMRIALVSFAALSFVVVPLNAPAQTASVRLAPVDEYFGRYNESVLEIRNRLDRLDAKEDADMQTPDEIAAIDYVQEAVSDWQHRYPADPWAVDSMARIVECYARAGAGFNPRASATLGILTHDYPNASQTGEAVLALADATTPEDEGAAQAGPAAILADAATNASEIVGEVVDATTGAPVTGAVVIVAPNHESVDLASNAFATTGDDGAFEVRDVPLGLSYTLGAVSLAHAEYIVVEPPRGSPYAAYHGMIDASGSKAQAGIIRLASR